MTMLQTISAITRKDLKILWKDPRGLANLFLMPIMFIFVMTMALGRMFGPEKPGVPNVVQHNVPAWTLFGLFFISQQIASSLLEEKKLGTFRRLQAAPLSKPALLLGKLAPFFLVNLAQVVTMFAVGVLVLPLIGAPRLAIGSHPAALVGVTVAASLAACGLGLLIAALARTTEQIGGLGSMLVVTMAALGGVMVPRMAMPKAMQTFGLLTPHSWALTAYQDVLVRGADLMAVLPAIGALLGFASIFFAVAISKFNWE